MLFSLFTRIRENYYSRAAPSRIYTADGLYYIVLPSFIMIIIIIIVTAKLGHLANAANENLIRCARTLSVWNNKIYFETRRVSRFSHNYYTYCTRTGMYCNAQLPVCVCIVIYDTVAQFEWCVCIAAAPVRHHLNCPISTILFCSHNTTQSMRNVDSIKKRRGIYIFPSKTCENGRKIAFLLS